MKIEDIPQDNSPSYHGQKKILYALRNGHYESATSSGWDTESYATHQAVAELDAQTQQARQAVLRGEKSPLYYWMYRYRHDDTSLAQAAGLWRWQLRRHLRPEIFARLPEKTLRRYADALQIGINTLTHLPAENDAP